MSYASTANRPNLAAALGALGAPLGFGVLLVAGLAVTVVLDDPIPNPTTVFTDPDVLPPVEPVPTPETSSSSSQTQTQTPPEFTNTRPDSEFDFELGPTAPVGELPGLDEDLTGTVATPVFEVPQVRQTPTFDPIAASPRGNPGEWITNNDYRTSWINRGYEGVAGFEVQIDDRGRVTECSITRSTGYSDLDNATCRLLERRARFNPAKDSSGNAISGSYSSSVNWQIP